MSPFKRGYIDGLHTDYDNSGCYLGRKRNDYQFGYRLGLYKSVLLFMKDK